VEKRSRINTRARLLTAAYDVFFEQGFQATTVEDLCARAGFTRGAFYSNFSSTDELFLALWDQQADRIVEGARSLVALADEMDDPFDLAQAAMVDLELVEPRWFVLNAEFLLYAFRNPEAAAQLQHHRSRLRHELEAVFAVLLRAEDRQLPDGVDLELLTRMLIAAHEGSQLQSLVDDQTLDRGQVQRTLINVLFTACPKLDD
jgi:AcrR family transcriptional regulator